MVPAGASNDDVVVHPVPAPAARLVSDKARGATSADGASPTHQTLSVLVENRSGVLARVSGLFARRGFNIISLAVAPSDDERFSRITIVIDVEETSVEQITKQLFKLVNVVKITELHPADAVERRAAAGHRGGRARQAQRGHRAGRRVRGQDRRRGARPSSP